MFPPFLNIPQTLCETRRLIHQSLHIPVFLSLSHCHLQFKLIYHQQLHQNCQPSVSLTISMSVPLLVLLCLYFHFHPQLQLHKMSCTHSFLYMTLNFINNTTSLKFAIFFHPTNLTFSKRETRNKASSEVSKL